MTDILNRDGEMLETPASAAKPPMPKDPQAMNAPDPQDVSWASGEDRKREMADNLKAKTTR